MRERPYCFTFTRLFFAGVFLFLLAGPVLAGTAGRLCAIRISEQGQATRCVLEIKNTRSAELSSHVLSAPERIYVDLKGFTLEKGALAGVKPAGLIKNIRAAQFDSKTVRVVFEFERRPNLVISRSAGDSGFVLDFSRAGGFPEKNDVITPTAKTPAIPNADAVKAAGMSPDVKMNIKPSRAIEEIRAGALKYEYEKARDGAGPECEARLAPGKKAAGQIKINNAPAPAAAQVINTTAPAAPLSQAQEIPRENDVPDRDGGVRFHKWRVVIDPGHGGHDPGTIGKNGHFEKDATLAIARKLAGILRDKPGYKVYLTRDADKFISLDERTMIANRLHADIFVSIHINSSPNPYTRGITTYFLNWTDDAEANRVAARENAISMKRMKAARSELGYILASLELEGKRDDSLKLANYIESSVTGGVRRFHPGEKAIGVKQALFYVLVGDKMPAVLVEVSFLSNHTDERLLQESSYIDEVAKGIARGIDNYFKGAPAQVVRTARR